MIGDFLTSNKKLVATTKFITLPEDVWHKKGVVMPTFKLTIKACSKLGLEWVYMCKPLRQSCQVLTLKFFIFVVS
jgi:hypothetical protein